MNIHGYWCMLHFHIEMTFSGLPRSMANAGQCGSIPIKVLSVMSDTHLDRCLNFVYATFIDLKCHSRPINANQTVNFIDIDQIYLY